MNRCASLFLALLTITSCSRSPPQRSAANAVRISGTVLERLDAPPHTFVRLETAEGALWAAVPVTDARMGKEITIVNAMPLKGFEAKSLGRRFELVYFGTQVGN